MRLLLVRHGQTTWNVERRVQGARPDVPLTELGRKQAEAAAEALAHEPVTAVWSSDLERALDTAAPIAARHGIDVHATALLREQALGEMEGKLSSELVAQPVPEGEHIAEVRWGGGESALDVANRMALLVGELRRCFAPDDTVVLVSHGDAIQILRALLDGRTHREVDWTNLGNGEVCAVTLADVG